METNTGHTTTPTHHFSELSDEYRRSRRGYLPSVIRSCAVSIRETCNRDQPIVLDVGCGTGIATRSLAAEDMIVVGVDADIAMVQQAIHASGPRVSYGCCDASAIPWDDNTFDGVVTFGAFHWFASRSVTKELVRVLKPGGSLTIVNKVDKSSARTVVREVTRRYGSNVPDPKVSYDPARLLRSAGLISVRTRNVKDTEVYSPGEFEAHIRTMAPWSQMPTVHHADAMREIFQALEVEQQPSLFVSRPIRSRIVTGYKPKLQLNA